METTNNGLAVTRKRTSIWTALPQANIRAMAVYPVAGTKKPLDDLKTVGIKLAADEAVRLAAAILVMAQDGEPIDITAYRTQPRALDGTHKVSVTSTQTVPTDLDDDLPGIARSRFCHLPNGEPNLASLADRARSVDALCFVTPGPNMVQIVTYYTSFCAAREYTYKVQGILYVARRTGYLEVCNRTRRCRILRRSRAAVEARTVTDA